MSFQNEMNAEKKRESSGTSDPYIVTLTHSFMQTSVKYSWYSCLCKKCEFPDNIHVLANGNVDCPIHGFI